MRRWNGWGEESIDYPLPESASQYLETLVGEGLRLPDASLETVLAAIPATNLPKHPLISTDPIERLRHARGQSLPDWIALRSGQIETFPVGVAYPSSDTDIETLLNHAHQVDAKVIPYGGGTSVVGHINPLPDAGPVLTLDLSCLNRLLDLDETSRLATFEAGVTGPDIERQLQVRGYTLGHFPQSFEYSTLGGWIATRSSGQQSYYYGRIEDLFAGGHLETPLGGLELLPYPASAAGPDLRHLVLGSEGRLGVITRATVRIQPVPEVESFHAAFFHDWHQGAEAVRTIAQSDIRLSMLRLSNALETITTLALSGKENLVNWAERGLRLLGYGQNRCLLIFGLTGTQQTVKTTYGAASAVIRQHGGLLTGTLIGKMWRKSRFTTPYLRNTLWGRGYALDTLETAMPWSSVLPAAEAILRVLQDGLADISERVLAFAHLSHVYNSGASLYITFLFRRSIDPGDTLLRWQRLKKAASQAILEHNGTISHQHGVGLDHAPYLATEKGPLGIQSLEAVRKSLDPAGILNPGKLLV